MNNKKQIFLIAITVIAVVFFFVMLYAQREIFEPGNVAPSGTSILTHPGTIQKAAPVTTESILSGGDSSKTVQKELDGINVDSMSNEFDDISTSINELGK